MDHFLKNLQHIERQSGKIYNSSFQAQKYFLQIKVVKNQTGSTQNSNKGTRGPFSTKKGTLREHRLK